MITIKSNLPEVKSFVTDLQRKQLPFALAKALTTLANEARADVVSGLPSKFTLRTTWWKPGNRYGFNVTVANKKDWPKPTAEIFTRAGWMAMQETGGIKKPKGQHIALPTANVRRTKRSLISASNRPMALRNTFKVMGRGGDEVLLQRIGRQEKVMYLLKPKAKVNSRLAFFNTIQRRTNSHWLRIFNEQFDRALKTAK